MFSLILCQGLVVLVKPNLKSVKTSSSKTITPNDNALMVNSLLGILAILC